MTHDKTQVNGAFVLAVLCALGGVTAFAPTARAYKIHDAFAADPIEGGGGERYFTGSRDDGFTCEVCHRGGATPEVGIELREYDDPMRDLRVTGYIPGTTYEVVVAMPRTSASSMTAEFVTDIEGRGVGALLALGAGDLAATEKCTPNPADTLHPDGVGTFAASAPNNRSVFTMDSCGIVEARFTWTAPPAPVGAIWFNAAIVAADEDGTPLGDGVRVYSQIIPLTGESSEATRTSTSCRAGGDARNGRASLLTLAAVLLLLLRRRTRGR